MNYINQEVIDLVITNKLRGEDISLQVKKEILYAVMKACKYNQSKAARSMGLSRTGLRIKLEEYFPGEFIEKRV